MYVHITENCIDNICFTVERYHDLLLVDINPETLQSRISQLVRHGNGKNVVQVEKGKYNITEGFVAAVCDSFGIVHHGIKQFIRRAALYLRYVAVACRVYMYSMYVRATRRVFARITLIKIYIEIHFLALPDILFKAKLQESNNVVSYSNINNLSD